MIAENREHAVRGFERRQQLGDRLDERAVLSCDVVAAEYHEIRLLRVGQRHRSRDVFGGNERAVVDVGEERDAQAVELRREPADRQQGLGDADPCRS